MFQAELRPAKLLKQIVEALKEIVVEVQLECSDQGMQVQAMDSSHVSLVFLELNASKFQSYRCEKAMSLGIHVGNLAKMLKCAGNDDTVQLKAQDGGDQLNIRIFDTSEDHVSEFSMKLLEIEADQLGIPQQDYSSAITFASSEFSRICKDIANFGDTVAVDVKKDSVSFAAQGDIGTGRMLLKARREVDVKPEAAKAEPKADAVKDEDATKVEKTTVKKEAGEAVTPQKSDADGEKGTPTKTDVKPEVKNDDNGDAPPKKRARKDKAEGEQEEKPKKEKEEKPEPIGVQIQCKEPVSLQFALRYLTMFSKAQSVSEKVNMKLVKDSPLQIEYEIAAPVGKDSEGEAATPGLLGTLRYYLAPKVGDGEEGEGGDAGAAHADDE